MKNSRYCCSQKYIEHVALKNDFNELIIFQNEIGSPTAIILVNRNRVGSWRAVFSSYRDLIERELHWSLSDPWKIQAEGFYWFLLSLGAILITMINSRWYRRDSSFSDFTRKLWNNLFVTHQTNESRCLIGINCSISEYFVNFVEIVRKFCQISHNHAL